MEGRLNLFQSAMLRWRELHPYCASHVITIDAVLDTERLRTAIAGVLGECGLAGLELDADRRRFGFEGGTAAVDLNVHEGGHAPVEVVAREIETTLNAPFPRDGRFDPFRFFAVTDGPDRFRLGLTYDHFIAGGDSIAVLLTDIADRYCGASVGLPRLERYPATYARLFMVRAAYLARGLASLPGLMAGWRRAIRPHLDDPAQGHNGFVHFAIDVERAARLRAASKRWNVTQNDVLIALTLRALTAFATRRSHTGRRRELALASIVNVRGDYQRAASEVFGQFLSSFRVVHPLPRDEPIEALARSVATQTARSKAGKLYLVTLVAVAAAGWLWRFASPARRQRLFLKYHPVFAGLTPLNVNALRRRGTSRDGDYLRAASTGPMAPMVIAVTTSGAALQVGITYRTTALARCDLDAVVNSLIAGMDDLK